MSNNIMYSAVNEAPIYESVDNNKGKKIINRILLGTYVETGTQNADFIKVKTAGPDGWMKIADLTDKMGLKIFILDVGQGDGILIENDGIKILVDAGPNDNMFKYLTKWQYKYLLNDNNQVKIDYLFISHFDTDHYKGLIKIIEHPLFRFENICHPGILKFEKKSNPYNTDLGATTLINGKEYLTTIFDDLLNTNNPSPFNRDISNLIEAIDKANKEGRIGKICRIEAGFNHTFSNSGGNQFKIEALAPFTENISGNISYLYFGDESKTINGHSLVLKLTFGTRTFLFGGDLNKDSENYLISKYPASNPFEVDVTKSCHHGSSDFTTDFMKLINALASIISSGDNESYSHPRADAIGCAGKYSRSARPLVFSTEIARSVDITKKKILFGMINCRCNGNDIYISQMKEMHTNGDLWDSYKV